MQQDAEKWIAWRLQVLHTHAVALTTHDTDGKH
jgi:hypothetical protein